jgi:hypothetical protein
MGRRVLHLSTSRVRHKGTDRETYVTSTACRREQLQTDANGGGNNSTDVLAEVTCKLCLKSVPYLKAKLVEDGRQAKEKSGEDPRV